MSSDAERNLPWLVKSSGRVLGPFTRDELIAKLHTKELVLLDEVSQPLSRWRYVRDEPGFARVVEDLRRGAYAGREDTMTTTSVSNSRTTEHDHTPLPEFSPTRRDLKWVWILTSVLATALLVIIALSLGDHIAVHNREATFDLLMQQGADAKRVGDFTGAMDLFKRAQQLRPNDADVNFILAPMLIAFEGQTVVGKRMLSRVEQLKYRRTELAQSKAAMGLASLIDGNLDEAKHFLHEALESQANFYSALANLGVIEHLRGNFDGAQDFFARALKESAGDNSLVVLMNRSELENLEHQQKFTTLNEVVNTLTHFAGDAFDYRQEAFLLAAYGSQLAGSAELDQRIDQVLDQDPKLTDQHIHELLIYRKPISWDSLFSMCHKIAESAPQTARKTVLLAHCTARNGNVVEARKLMEDAHQKAPQDMLIKAHLSLLLHEMGQDSEALTVIGSVDQANPVQLSHLALARICESRGDVGCTETSLKHLLALNASSIQAIEGLAKLAQARHEVGRTTQLIQQGLQLSPSYIPLLQLQRSINENSAHP